MSDLYPPGSVIGPYRIVKSLQATGAGAASGIYLAHQLPGHQSTPYVVIKIMSLEAQQASQGDIRRIEHPNLIRLLPIRQLEGMAAQSPQYAAQIDPNDPSSPWYAAWRIAPADTGAVPAPEARCGR
jgi:hypothetical protein